VRGEWLHIVGLRAIGCGAGGGDGGKYIDILAELLVLAEAQQLLVGFLVLAVID
jgi:hypothetical protein